MQGCPIPNQASGNENAQRPAFPGEGRGRKQNRNVLERVKNRQEVVFWPAFQTLSPDAIEHQQQPPAPRLSLSPEITVRPSLELRPGCDAPQAVVALHPEYWLGGCLQRVVLAPGSLSPLHLESLRPLVSWHHKLLDLSPAICSYKQEGVGKEKL